MIRKAAPEDYMLLSEIWLNASIAAHDFVPAEFWEKNAEDMREVYLPGSETWVIEADGNPAGFFCLSGNVLAAIFVTASEQGSGLGSRLIERAKELRENLELTVYKENPRAVSFYQKHGFSVREERIDVHTSHTEFVMMWSR